MTVTADTAQDPEVKLGLIRARLAKVMAEAGTFYGAELSPALASMLVKLYAEALDDIGGIVQLIPPGEV